MDECDDARLSDECQEALDTILAKSSSRLETCLVEEVLRAIDGERNRFRANSKASVLMRLLEDFVDGVSYDPKCLESLSTLTREVLVKDRELWSKVCGLSDYAKDIYDKLKSPPFTYAVFEYNSSLLNAIYYLQTAFREKHISKKSVYYGLLEELVSYTAGAPYNENHAASAQLRDVMRRFHQASSVSALPCADFPEESSPSTDPLPSLQYPCDVEDMSLSFLSFASQEGNLGTGMARLMLNDSNQVDVKEVPTRSVLIVPSQSKEIHDSFASDAPATPTATTMTTVTTNTNTNTSTTTASPTDENAAFDRFEVTVLQHIIAILKKGGHTEMDVPQLCKWFPSGSWSRWSHSNKLNLGSFVPWLRRTLAAQSSCPLYIDTFRNSHGIVCLKDDDELNHSEFVNPKASGNEQPLQDYKVQLKNKNILKYFEEIGKDKYFDPAVREIDTRLWTMSVIDKTSYFVQIVARHEIGSMASAYMMNAAKKTVEELLNHIHETTAVVSGASHQHKIDEQAKGLGVLVTHDLPESAVICEHPTGLVSKKLHDYCESKLSRGRVKFGGLICKPKLEMEDKKSCSPGKCRTRLKILPSSGDVVKAMRLCLDFEDTDVRFINVAESPYCISFVFHTCDGHFHKALLARLGQVESDPEKLQSKKQGISSTSSGLNTVSNSRCSDYIQQCDTQGPRVPASIFSGFATLDSGLEESASSSSDISAMSSSEMSDFHTPPASNQATVSTPPLTVSDPNCNCFVMQTAKGNEQPLQDYKVQLKNKNIWKYYKDVGKVKYFDPAVAVINSRLRTIAVDEKVSGESREKTLYFVDIVERYENGSMVSAEMMNAAKEAVEELLSHIHESNKIISEKKLPRTIVHTALDLDIYATTSLFNEIEMSITVLCEHSKKLKGKELCDYCKLKLSGEVMLGSFRTDPDVYRRDQMGCALGNTRTRLEISWNSGDVHGAMRRCVNLDDSLIRFIDPESSYCAFFVYYESDGPPEKVLFPRVGILESDAEKWRPYSQSLEPFASTPMPGPMSDSTTGLDLMSSAVRRDKRAPLTDTKINALSSPALVAFPMETTYNEQPLQDYKVQLKNKIILKYYKDVGKVKYFDPAVAVINSRLSTIAVDKKVSGESGEKTLYFVDIVERYEDGSMASAEMMNAAKQAVEELLSHIHESIAIISGENLMQILDKTTSTSNICVTKPIRKKEMQDAVLCEHPDWLRGNELLRYCQLKLSGEVVFKWEELTQLDVRVYREGRAVSSSGKKVSRLTIHEVSGDVKVARGKCLDLRDSEVQFVDPLSSSVAVFVYHKDDCHPDDILRLRIDNMK